MKNKNFVVTKLGYVLIGFGLLALLTYLVVVVRACSTYNEADKALIEGRQRIEKNKKLQETTTNEGK